jgi:Na+-driven multidrug efflux pump
MILAGHRLLSWWVGPAAAPGTLLIGGVALYFCAREWTALHAMLLNGLNVIRPQVPTLVITAGLTLAFDILLIRRFGPLGLAVGGLLAFLFAGAGYLPYLTTRALSTSTSKRSRSRTN